MTERAPCDVCPKRCLRLEGERGFCLARKVTDGVMCPLYYGKVISLALDPIEKKPFYRFHPGTKILSVGGIGCNMNCTFCQNHEIASPNDISELEPYLEEQSPESLVQKAIELKPLGNIGIAFTYNEPLINVEFVRDTFALARQHGLHTALVTNGQISDLWLRRLLPLAEAWNIDLKCFHQSGYLELGGDFKTTKNTIEKAASVSHVEVTTLVVPGLSDDHLDMEHEARWLAAISPQIPLHLSRFFPRHKRQNVGATPLETLYRLRQIASLHLAHVYLGNV